jgi:sulfide:quinone oxidoreductase
MSGDPKISADPLRVVIAGGGVGALEGLLALRALAGELVDVTLLAPEPEFRHRPLSVTEPFGLAAPRRLALAEVARQTDATLIADGLEGVDTERRRVRTTSGSEIEYDALLIAIGAPGTEAIPGAVAFRDSRDEGDFQRVLGEIERGDARRLAFAVPSGRAWALGLYELALLSAAQLRNRGVTDAELTVVTPESRPLAVFGPRAGDSVSELLERAGIELRANAAALAFADGRLEIRGAPALECDRAISIPAPAVAEIAGLPQDREGFIPIDHFGGVLGAQRVFAAGDATNFPVKQGGLAAQLADCAASAIAALAGAPVTPQSFRPVLRGALLTEWGPRYMRTPLDDPEGGIVSSSILWWPPVKVAGRYLGPFLAPETERRKATQTLEDLQPRPVAPPPGADSAHRELVGQALRTADQHADTQDYRGALRWLEVAEDLELYLPAEYEAKRQAWRQALA